MKLQFFHWFSSEDLDLIGEWKAAWDNYIRGLEYGRIRLSNQNDSILWSHNNFTGALSAAEGYKCLFSNISSENNDSVLKILWSLNIPLKLKCFIWLLIRGKILTWEQLQSRGFSGPSHCVLCEDNMEDIHHLFFSCPFSVRIYKHFEERFKCSFPAYNSVHSFLDLWFTSSTRSAQFRYLPLFIIW